MRLLKTISILCCLTFFSCEEEIATPSDNFLKIYDDKDYNAVYQPIGVHSTDSNIYILTERRLNSSNFSGINIIKTNNEGDYMEEIVLPEQYVAPTRGFQKIGNSLYFFCMDGNSLAPYLGSIGPSAEVNLTPLAINNSYPLAAAIDNRNQLILLAYNQEDKQSNLAVVTTTGAIQSSASYSIGAGNDVLEAVVNHFTRSNSRLPFFCGQAPNESYYFNGFYNYTLSTVFTKMGEEPVGVIQGQATNAALKYLLPIGGNDFAFIAYQFDDTFMSASVTLPVNEVSSSVNFFDRKVPEIKENTISKIISYNYNNDNLIIIAAETEGRQVVLYIYDEAGKLMDTYFLGTLNPYTFADIVMLEDGAIGIVGTTFLADRFERVYLQKISRDRLLKIN